MIVVGERYTAARPTPTLGKLVTKKQKSTKSTKKARILIFFYHTAVLF
jgi:hypothetical protein